MNKAFTRENDVPEDDDEELVSVPALPLNKPNYITPNGFARLKSELDYLTQSERPALVATVAWAAGNGDRSENGDYIYGKKRLREIDRRIRFLVKRLDAAVVVDPLERRDEEDRVYFGATVEVIDEHEVKRTLSIVGIDEFDPARGRISWISPMAVALLRARVGDSVMVQTPSGKEALEILSVRYQPLEG